MATATAPKPKKITDPVKQLGIRKTADVNTRRRLVGKRTQMSMTEFWAYLFNLNEGLPKNNKMTDEEIKRQLIEEFPKSKTAKALAEGNEKLSFFRCRYNAGAMTNGEVPGTANSKHQRSHRYNEDGVMIDPMSRKPITAGSNGKHPRAAVSPKHKRTAAKGKRK